MSYTTVVLQLDPHPGMDDRIDQAARLARRFEGHLVGVAAADHSLFGVGVATGFAGAPRLAEAVHESRAAARARVQHFQERLAVAPCLVSFEGVVDDEDEVTALVRRSSCCDLLVLGQPDPAWPDFARCRDRLEHVLLQSVAPTLLLPFSGRHGSVGDNVMIAWDGSQGAARAVAGALPMLKRAKYVHLARCDTVVEADTAVETPGFDLPREWLGRHGVRFDARLERATSDVGTVLLTRARELGADLIVMGAWGMPRWAERLVGGATRTVLSGMDVPVLMAH
jgi:nucleotide-binding universal stress UspA family protein